MVRLRRLLVVCLLAIAAGWAVLRAEPTAQEPPAPADGDFFERDVKPILQAQCWKCHGPQKSRGGLRLDSRAALLRGGDLGPAISLNAIDDSLILKAIHYRDGLEMPPSGRLPAEQLAVLTRWIKAGAPWPGADLAPAHDKRPDSARPTPPAAAYWAYQPVRPQPVPPVKNASWVRQPVDAFILSKLEAAGLHPNPPADPATLVRRVYYDLLGLPPTPEQVQEFLRDTAADAYERLLDRLLASPHYGEKWGRHWLDVVRYAESNGYERDGTKPFAWKYRDYVVRSFNEDKPYQQFLREQLAGDELPGRGPDAIIATGFYRLGLWDDEPADPLQARYDEFDDIVATVGQGFLGMTINCCRCHDHKADPLPQTDYYGLLAFFRDIPPYSDTRNTRSKFNITDISPPELREKYAAELERRERRIAELTQAMTRIEDAVIRRMSAEDQRASEGPDRQVVIDQRLKLFITPDEEAEYTRLHRERESLQRQPEPQRELALSVNNCIVPPPPTTVLIRGNPHSPGAPVEPAFPAVLQKTKPVLPTPSPGAKTSGRRAVLADWIASPDNPLTARVFVNRVWQYHFGRGLVATPNDFGKLGEMPTHPELLDWLADDFVRGGWRLKRLHKLLMTSSTYRQASTTQSAGQLQDPGNTLLWRFPPRRLTAEEIRDSMLAVSGQLRLELGGPSVYPPIPRAVLAGQSMPGDGWGKSTPAEANRRTIYVHVKRSLQLPILALHDQADTDNSCPVRFTTTVPTQALGMLNGDFTFTQATELARRLQREAPGDFAAQVQRLIYLTTGRPAAEQELSRDLALLRQLQSLHQLDETSALIRLCLLQLNTNAFVYLD